MTANELYQRKPVYVTKAPYHLLDLELDGAFYFPYTKTADDFEERVYDHWQYDGSRSRRLSGIFYKGKPVAITQFSGRKNSDYSRIYVTDKEGYAELMGYLQKLMILHNEELNVIDPDKNDDRLTRFHGDVTDDQGGIGRPGFAITKPDA